MSSSSTTTASVIASVAAVLRGPPAPEVPPLLSIREAAELLRVDQQVIRGAIRRGELTSIRAGRQHRIRRQDLAAYLRRGK